MTADRKTGAPRICLGCGEWFDPEGEEKVCSSPGCRSRATIIGRAAADHAAMVKQSYRGRWQDGDAEQALNHARWREAHPPGRGAPDGLPVAVALEAPGAGEQGMRQVAARFVGADWRVFNQFDVEAQAQVPAPRRNPPRPRGNNAPPPPPDDFEDEP